MAGQLRQQLKQRRPFRSIEAEVFLNVLRTSTTFVGQLVEVLRPYELTQPQYNVLRILRGAGAVGLPCGEVGERMVSREPDVTRLLDRMEQRGLVARARDAADRRVVTARLTADGRKLVDALDAPVEALHARQLGHLSAADLRTLNALLESARDEDGAGGGGDD
ncbi:MAG TPA: MarR family transcriptional regulator [Gemmatimonadaceae bacterium]